MIDHFWPHNVEKEKEEWTPLPLIDTLKIRITLEGKWKIQFIFDEIKGAA